MVRRAPHLKAEKQLYAKCCTRTLQEMTKSLCCRSGSSTMSSWTTSWDSMSSPLEQGIESKCHTKGCDSFTALIFLAKRGHDHTTSTSTSAASAAGVPGIGDAGTGRFLESLGVCLFSAWIAILIQVRLSMVATAARIHRQARHCCCQSGETQIFRFTQGPGKTGSMAKDGVENTGFSLALSSAGCAANRAGLSLSCASVLGGSRFPDHQSWAAPPRILPFLEVETCQLVLWRDIRCSMLRRRSARQLTPGDMQLPCRQVFVQRVLPKGRACWQV